MSSKRLTADERRADVLVAAIDEFAAKGLHGASTEMIAAAAGISHPYLFKLFGGKRELFLASFNRVCDRIQNAFRLAADMHPDRPLPAMGDAYYALLGQRDELRLLLHGFAAAGDPEIGDVVRARYSAMYRFARELSGANPREMREFWAHGMLLTIAAAMDLPLLAGKEAWIEDLLDFST